MKKCYELKDCIFGIFITHLIRQVEAELSKIRIYFSDASAAERRHVNRFGRVDPAKIDQSLKRVKRQGSILPSLATKTEKMLKHKISVFPS